MRMPLTLLVLHQHSNLSGRTSILPSALTLSTSTQTQTLIPSLLRSRPASSSGDDNAEFKNKIRRLIATQLALDDLYTISGATMREMVHSARVLKPEEHRKFRDEILQAEIERRKLLGEMARSEGQRLSENDPTLGASKGSNAVIKMARLAEERAAEPRYGLTPDELKTVNRAVSSFTKSMKRSAMVGTAVAVALGTGVLYCAFSIVNWSP